MQQTHRHKAVTRHVEAKKLLSDLVEGNRIPKSDNRYEFLSVMGKSQSGHAVRYGKTML